MKTNLKAFLFIVVAMCTAYFGLIQKKETTVKVEITSETPDRVTDSKMPPSGSTTDLLPAPPPVNLQTVESITAQGYGTSQGKKPSAVELQQLKKLTADNSKRIFTQMKLEEIQSLRSSIVNDEKILKDLESSGTGIEDYQFIEENLLKRRTRLKALLLKDNKKTKATN